MIDCKIVSNYLSIYLSKDEVIKLAADENPTHQRAGRCQAQKPLSLVYPDTKAWRQVIQGLRDLAARDGGSIGFIVRKAVLEYVKHHHPGNNQLTLSNYTGTEPFSPAAQEKLLKQATVAEKGSKPLSDEDYEKMYPEMVKLAKRVREEKAKKEGES